MRVRSLCGVLVGLLCVATPALPQNLVTNGGFATDTSGWTSLGAGAGTRAWDSSDAAGAAGSGSAHMTLTDASAGAVIGLSQCIDISAQPALSTYKFFASINGASQTSESRAIVEALFYSDTGCTTSLDSGDGQGGTAAAFPGISPPWQTSPGSASAGGNEGTSTAPAGANGLQLRIYLERTSGSSAQNIYFDSVVLHNATTTPVLLTTFEAE